MAQKLPKMAQKLPKMAQKLAPAQIYLQHLQLFASLHDDHDWLYVNNHDCVGDAHGKNVNKEEVEFYWFTRFP